MRGKSTFGWQTSLADLSLILFMLAAVSLHNRPPAAKQNPASPQSEPLAVYDSTPGSPSLSTWLDQQAVDPRQQLTITARYGSQPGSREAALRDAVRLLNEAGAHGVSARIVVEPGAGPVRVALAYDVPQTLRD